jgi:hypothetical protein
VCRIALWTLGHPTIMGLKALPSVDFSPLADIHHQDHKPVIVDLVGDAVITDASSPGLPTAELLDSMRPGFIGQAMAGIGDPLPILSSDSRHCTLGPPSDKAGVNQSVFPSWISRMACSNETGSEGCALASSYPRMSSSSSRSSLICCHAASGSTMAVRFPASSTSYFSCRVIIASSICA